MSAQDESTDSIIQRLAELEHSNRMLTQRVARQARRARAACATLVVVVAAAMVMGQNQPKPPPEPLIEAETIVAERVFITDKTGMKRGVFTILPDGRAALLLSEANPRPKAAAGLTVAMDGSSSLVLADRDGN